MDYTDQVKRTDLKLREKHPTIKTRIFRKPNARYIIVVDEYIGKFSDLSEEFNNSIRPLHLLIEVDDNVPDDYEEEVPSIDDKNIPFGFRGMQFNSYDVKNHIESQFHGLTVVDVSYNSDAKILQLDVAGDGHNKEEVEKTIANIGIVDQVQVTCSGANDLKISGPENPVFYISSSHGLSVMKLPFLRRDEELWFDNIENIYNGTMTKGDLFFFNTRQKACFINYSLFNHINIRNQLLLYDVIYCTLPLLGHLNDFFLGQAITRKEFLYLVQKGRIKVIITQPEFRHEYDFFRDIFEINPNAIISRRAIAALCAIDLVDINRNYLLNDPEIVPFVRPLIAAISEVSEADPKSIANMLMWPNSALRASFELLHSSSTKRISNYGVNQVLLNSASEEFRKKFEFEFVVNAEAIHMAHALDATYFPHISDASGYSDEPYALMMGNLLNYYKNFNKANVSEVLDTERLKDSGVRILNPIYVIEANTYLPIPEFEEIAGTKYIRDGFNSLFDELSSLDTNERNERIREYNEELQEHLGYDGFKGGMFDLGTDATGIPFFGVGKRISTFIYGKVKEKSSGFSAFAERVEAIANMSISGDPRITLLAKINRIARLTRM